MTKLHLIKQYLTVAFLMVKSDKEQVQGTKRETAAT